VDDIYYFIFWVSLVAFIAICVATAWFAFRYRRSRVGVVPEDSPHHSTAIEIVWSVVPAVLMVAMFWYGFVDYVDRRTMPEDAMRIDVSAQKWVWSFRYPNGAQVPGVLGTIGANQDPAWSKSGLHVPPNEPVVFRIMSNDVLHSFSVPSMRVKMDAVPGRYTYAWFEATKPGVYDLYCTEYCGQQHSQMLSKVIVHPSRADYESWVASQVIEKEPSVAYGEYLYNLKGCVACHSVDGNVVLGPTFQGSYGAERNLADGSSVTIDENYIRQSILDPMSQIALKEDGGSYLGVMPAFQGQVDDVDLAALIEFIKAQNPQD
jgi:cytochrome c oxidase subunit 2